MKNPETRDRPASLNPDSDHSPVRFGPFVLDGHLKKLWRDGVLVPLPSRALEALGYLIAHRDRAVDREEIISAVWHDVAVTDDSLIHAISVLRRALGDNPAQASFIETIPRRGYRFTGHVEPAEDAVQAEPVTLLRCRSRVGEDVGPCVAVVLAPGGCRRCAGCRFCCDGRLQEMARERCEQ